MIVLVMGISGSGKTRIGRLLAQRLGWAFCDADDLHSRANKAKMAAGTALTDEDRWPWLEAIRQTMEDARTQGQHRVFACSALKRAYRRYLCGAADDIRLVFLDGPPELLAERLAARRGHFFNPQLLQSQLDSLEPPTADEAWIMDIRQPPEAIVETLLRKLGR